MVKFLGIILLLTEILSLNFSQEIPPIQEKPLHRGAGNHESP